MKYTISTQSDGNGKNACYTVWFNREVVATFPINDPSVTDAKEYAKRFAASMNRYLSRAVQRLVKR